MSGNRWQLRIWIDEMNADLAAKFDGLRRDEWANQYLGTWATFDPYLREGKSMNIIEAAREMLTEAKRAGRTPLRWDINAAGLVALQTQSDFSRNDDIRPMLERKLLSLPMALTHDNSEDPKLALVVEEAWRRGRR